MNSESNEEEAPAGDVPAVPVPPRQPTPGGAFQAPTTPSTPEARPAAAPTPPTPPADPTTSQPNRFEPGDLVKAGVLLIGLFAAVVGVLVATFWWSGLIKSGSSPNNGYALALLAIAALLLISGIFCFLVEAKKPPEPSAATTPAGPPPGGGQPPGVNPTELLKGVVDSLQGQKTSNILFALFFVTMLIAAAGSGLVSLSIGTPATTTTTTTAPPKTSTPPKAGG